MIYMFVKPFCLSNLFSFEKNIFSLDLIAPEMKRKLAEKEARTKQKEKERGRRDWRITSSVALLTGSLQ